jgi:hypothetical protein
MPPSLGSCLGRDGWCMTPLLRTVRSMTSISTSSLVAVTTPAPCGPAGPSLRSWVSFARREGGKVASSGRQLPPPTWRRRARATEKKGPRLRPINEHPVEVRVSTFLALADDKEVQEAIKDPKGSASVVSARG